jgi:hypothetical protein
VTTWHAEFADDLAELGGVVHDAWFDIDGVVHDEACQTLVIPFAQEWEWGPMLEDPAWPDAPKPELTRTTWRYREERVPFMRGTLRIADVESVAIDKGARDAAMLLGIRYDSTTRSITVEGVSGNLLVRVQRLHVTVEFLPEVVLYVRRRHGRFGGASDVPLWSERLERAPAA